ncbi:MAG: choice-of-anchor L domain-containing protein [Flavobacteriales bacterium]|nr:choice-of-anchor L domain-containing protein [Flavobacteriales bacterium]
MGRSSFPIILLTVVLNTGTVLGQLVVNNAQSPQQLVEDVLIGQGVQVSNIQFTGDAQGRGYFNGANSNIGLSDGVILSSGLVTDAVGPNETPFSDQGTDFNRPGYPALAIISGSPAGTKDAAILEFDFVPSSDTIRFRYKFASNEYMTYVGADVNDVFAFLISGPGLSGEQNIALIPGTATPVAIDNVNANVNAQYYIDNENPPGQTVEYNGFTTVFTAIAILTPCETYHIKLAIADAGDGLYDSAVFLEAGSFSSPTVNVEPSTNFSASATGLELVEGCSQLSLSFERSAPFDNPLTVDISLTGTATPGADYSGIGSSITFAAGQGTVNVTIMILEDGVAENVESVTISMLDVNPCATGPLQEVSFTILDALRPTVVSSPAASFFCPVDYNIMTDVTGGYPPFTYTWSGMPGETGTNITVSPLTTTNYTVTVADQCGFTASASTNVTMNGYVPVAVSVADAQICNGGDTEVTAVVTGGAGTITYQWDSGENTSSYIASPTVETPVWVQVTDSCGFAASDSAIIRVDDFQATFTAEHERQDSYLFTNTSPGTQTVHWDFGDGASDNEPRVRHTYTEEGEYTVTLTAVNVNGCESDSSIQVKSYPPMQVYVPSSFTPNGDGLNDLFGMTGEAYQGYVLSIYTRWGQQIHRGVHYDADAWDGTLNGELVPRGLYLWKIEVRPFAGMNVLKEGTVMVLPD